MRTANYKFEFPMKSEVISPMRFRIVMYTFLAMMIVMSAITIGVDTTQNSFITRSYDVGTQHDEALSDLWLRQSILETRLKNIEQENEILKDLIRKLMEK